MKNILTAFIISGMISCSSIPMQTISFDREILKVPELNQISSQELGDTLLEYRVLASSQSWKIKKSLSNNVSNKLIDDAYDAAINCGALGGKILGAGGGGFILIFAEPHKHRKIKKTLETVLSSCIIFCSIKGD